MRNEDRGGWRGRGRSRHLAILGEIGGSEVNYDKRLFWTTGRLSVYFLCGNANKIYLDALRRRQAVLRPRVAENACECKMPVESVCPETDWFVLKAESLQQSHWSGEFGDFRPVGQALLKS